MSEYCHVVTCWAHVPCAVHEHSNFTHQLEGTLDHPQQFQPPAHVPTQLDAAIAKSTAQEAAEVAVAALQQVVLSVEHGLACKELGPNAEQELVHGHHRTSMQDSTQPLGSHSDIRATALVETAQEAAAIAKEITDRQFGVTHEQREEAEQAAVEVAKAAESVREAVAQAVAQAVADIPMPAHVMEDAVSSAVFERAVATEAATEAFHEAADAIRTAALATPEHKPAAAFAANAAVARAEQVVMEAKTGEKRRASQEIVASAELAAQAAAEAAAEAVMQSVSHVKFDPETILAAEMVAAIPDEVMHAVASAVANAEANSEATAHPPETAVPTVLIA